MLAGHLAVWGWLLLLPPSLAHNHTCHRTEKVEVRVAIPLQEPATFRSYTWCLKVPPRCSKYTVVMRERITFETEVRNRTISECCVGHISLYGTCVPACTDCPNMLCDSERNCTCRPGYLGVLCNETCDVGKWGDRCLEACTCRLGEDCNPISGRCTPSTSTVPPTTTTPTPPPTIPSPPSTASVSSPSSSSTITPTTRNPTTQPPAKNISTTPNSYVNLTPTDPTTSTEDLTDFNIILRPRMNDSVRLVNNNNDLNSLNALGDFDYPVLPTDSGVETYNYIQPDHEPTKNSVSVDGSVVNAQWISELGSHSGVTVGSALGLLALLVVTVSAVIRCRNSKVAQLQGSPVEKNSLHLVGRNNHYAVPGPPSFSFINGYGLDLARVADANDDLYDEPRSVRCLANEPVYDELRY